MRMGKTTKILSVALLAICLITAFAACAQNEADKSAAAMTVLQITDVHMRNDDRDERAFETIDMLLEASNPDIVIVTGDVTSEKDNEPAIKKFCDFMESKKIPWAFTFGNHDAEGDWAKSEISDYLETLEYCVYERGDDSVDGYGNYYINVKDVNGKVVSTLIMMDSNMYYHDESIGGYDNFHENQIEWYENTIKSIAESVNGDAVKVVPSLAFFHIPMSEYLIAYNEAYNNGNINFGQKNEDVYCSKVEDEMFETMLKLGSTKGVFTGHDHMNDYSVDYQGIRLSYGNTCDHTMYMAPRKGGIAITVMNDGSFRQQNLYRHLGAGKLNKSKIY